MHRVNLRNQFVTALDLNSMEIKEYVPAFMIRRNKCKRILS